MRKTIILSMKGYENYSYLSNGNSFPLWPGGEIIQKNLRMKMVAIPTKQ
jgi:hypothetical protein